MPAGPSVALVVDADEEPRAKTSYDLEACGYRVLRADSAEIACIIFELRNPPVDIAIVRIDARRGASAIEIVERLRRIEPSLPCILISRSKVSALMNVPGFEAHSADFLPGPLTPERLDEAVKRRLQPKTRVAAAHGREPRGS